jgi:PAS domain S-box-containing protein
MAKKLTYEELEQRVKELEELAIKLRRGEEELLREKAFAESLLATAQAIVLVLDTEGRIVLFNPYMEQISGYRLDEVQGRDWFTTFLPKRDQHRIRELFQQAVTDIQTHGNVNPIITKDGQQREIEWYDKTLNDGAGNIIGLLAIGQDMTKRKRLEDELRKHQEHLEKAVKERTAELAKANEKLKREINDRKRAEAALQQRTHDLGERVKELNCLYGISELVEKPDISLDDIFQGTVDLMPGCWQYPEITCARAIVEGRKFTTENFQETNWRQTKDIIIRGETIGSIEVCYLEEKPLSYEGPFLKEERSLINAVAKQLGHIVKRIRAEEELRKTHGELEAHSRHLEEVNIALKVLLKQREEDRKDLEENVLSNVKQLVIPHLERLKQSRLDTIQATHVSTLESNLNNIVSPFISRLSSSFVNLTPMETRVADLIKEGKTNKEIGEMLCLSPNTVKFHRYNVRTKLGLKNKKINLRSYLLSLAK